MNSIAERLSAWVLRGRWHASAALSLTYLLAIWLPFLVGPLFIFSSALVVLLVLQVGTRPLLEVLLISALTVTLVTFRPAIGLSLLILCLPAWVIGESLRLSGSLRGVSWVLMILGTLGVALAVFATPTDPTSFWLNQFKPVFAGVSQGQDAALAALRDTAPFLPGIMASSFALAWVAALQLGRFLQASYTEEHAMLGEPFRDWNLPSFFLFLLPLAFLLAWLEQGIGGIFAQNFTLFLGAIFLVQGLAVVHTLAAMRNWSWQGLLFFYGLLIFFAYLSFVVIGLGIADKALNLRQRWQNG